ncbi:hypothetical protein [Elizabethkingia miricola]|uniref:hypothetical protein n=1 Tax=Elizabethkingia miricola TaxID=172045 RepID=UPI000B362D01|nr:hypothetical protein [Elizabethkingia miricola]
MYTSDKQMLKLPGILKSKGIVPLITDFYNQTGLAKALFSNVKNQHKMERGYHFTPEQIERVGNIYGINFNWFFGTSDEIFGNKK